MMRCEEVRTHLDDYVDGALDGTQRDALAAHLAECAACSEIEGSLRALLDEARALPSDVEPERDLWPGIAARLEGTVVEFAGPRRRARRLAVLPYAVAVAVVLALMTSVAVLRQGAPPEETAPGVERISEAEAAYIEARGTLRAVLDAGYVSLPPETLDVVKENLEVIDGAVEEIRSALAKSPHDPLLERMLFAAYESEVRILQQALQLAEAG